MSFIIQDCIELMEQLAPASYAFDWDNVGLILGHPENRFEKILVTLTITEQIVKRAVDEKVHLIISHHPLIFKPVFSIRTDKPLGRLIEILIQYNIAVFCCHTNLDRAPMGLNYWLAQDLGLKQQEILQPDEKNAEIGLGRIGIINPISVINLVSHLGLRWKTKVRYVGDTRRRCKRIAICGGSGGDLIYQAKAKDADALITGDVGYHQALDAQALDVVLIDAGHFATEQIMIKKVAQYLQAKLPHITVLQGVDGDNPFIY